MGSPYVDSGQSSSFLSPGTASQVLHITHSAYPIVILAMFLGGFIIQSIQSSKAGNESSVKDIPNGPNGRPSPKYPRPGEDNNGQQVDVDFSSTQKALFNWLSVAVIATFIGNAVNIIVHALTERPWWCGQPHAIYLTTSVFLYSVLIISMVDTKPAPSLVHLSTWVTSLVLEVVLLVASVSLYTSSHLVFTRASYTLKLARKQPNGWELTELLLDGVRIFLIGALIGAFTGFANFRVSRKRTTDREDAGSNGGISENTGLLETSHGVAATAKSPLINAKGPVTYGSTLENPKPERPKTPPAGWSRPTTAPSKSWMEYLKGYTVFFPYLWPAKSRRLQTVVVVCFALVTSQRALNLLLPHQVGVITNILSGENEQSPYVPWGEIILFIFYRLLQGTGGALGALRASLWIPIGQYSYQALSTAAFEHVHSLSLDFHLGKRTGEVISALSKGSAINSFLEQVTFSVLPMFVDLTLAIGYFFFAFDAYYACIVAMVTFFYLYFTVRMAQWRAEIRRTMVNASRNEEAVKNDSMVSYETVKYFNAEAYEFNRYREAVQAYQDAEYKLIFSLNIMNVVQNMVFTTGLMITCFIAAYQVTVGQCKVGQFVTLLTLMAQLQSPLNWFGTFYRSIQSAMINSERMLELFKEQPTVVDGPNVKQVMSCRGEIRFEDVHFRYDSRKAALDGITFDAPPGTTTALVGESGGGKSTIFRLLFRFYNVDSGRILVDGEDVRDISIDSLRRHIGVVPQDTVLFNETLMYNLKYANPAATDEMVFDACRAASIHDRILTFPDGYLTRVGERGLRLSGGEKQRVAIARTILKDPRIILLDEATAALDSETEQNIQSALQTLSKGRTMLVIAHRLSTITNADQILCLHAGRVAESGTHEQLLNMRGRYATMWKKQIRAERAAEEARALKKQAEELKDESANGGVSGDATDKDSEANKTAMHAKR